jgi:hypothetical protein
MNLTDNEVFTIALHESAHFITGVYYGVQEGVRQEFEIMTILENDDYWGHTKIKGETLIKDNYVKYKLAGYVIELIELPHKQQNDFIRKLFYQEVNNDKSDIAHCMEFIVIKSIDKVAYSAQEILIKQFSDAEKDCRTLRQDIYDVAKILFENKTIEGKAINELTNKYYLKYNQ